MTELTNENSSATAESSASTKTEVTDAKKQGKKARSAQKTNRARSRPRPNAPRPAKKPATKATTARDGTKTAQVLALLKRKNGATLAEIMKSTGWQAHSVRGFISGALGKKMGIN